MIILILGGAALFAVDEVPINTQGVESAIICRDITFDIKDAGSDTKEILYEPTGLKELCTDAQSQSLNVIYPISEIVVSVPPHGEKIVVYKVTASDGREATGKIKFKRP